MINVTLSNLLKDAKAYFDVVEAGDTVIVERRGKPIAQMVPLPGTPRLRKPQRPKLMARKKPAAKKAKR